MARFPVKYDPTGLTVFGMDPGLHGCGVALLDERHQILQSGWVPAPYTADQVARWRGTGQCGRTWDLMAREVHDWLQGVIPGVAVLEHMEVYKGRSTYGDDLLQLQAICGAVTAFVPSVWRLTPQPKAWKGSRSKSAHHAQLRTILTSEELERLDAQLHNTPANRHHDHLDAVALAMWAARRLR